MWVTKNEQTGRWINFNVFFLPRDCNVQPDNLMVFVRFIWEDTCSTITFCDSVFTFQDDTTQKCDFYKAVLSSFQSHFKDLDKYFKRSKYKTTLDIILMKLLFDVSIRVSQVPYSCSHLIYIIYRYINAARSIFCLSHS